MYSKTFKGFVAALAIIAMLIIGGFAVLLASFTSSGSFYIPIIVILFLALSIWLIIWAAGKYNLRVRIYSFLGIVLCAGIAIGCYQAYNNYIDNIPVVSDREVDLSVYQPFAEGTKAVLLDDSSTFKIHGDLPRIDGATALYPLYSAFVQATYPKKDYSLYSSEVRGGTTPAAYNRLLDGEVDMILCAGPSEEQVEMAARRGKVFNMIPIGKEAFVFFVSKENPVKGLSYAQIQDIYSGAITNWKELGGKDQEIKAFQRPANSGSQTMLEKIMNGKQLMRPPLNDVVGGMGAIIDRTAEYKNFDNAIGYTFLFFAVGMKKNDDIRLLSIDGVYPNRSTIESGEYPFTGDFYAITTDTKNENVPAFIEWILSPQGQSLVEKTGYTPLGK